MRKVILIGLGLAALAGQAAAQEAAYIDDRSEPAALIRSLYNAINRHEYARAWSYFSKPPADTIEAYAAGFADTQHVELRTGHASEEGAAGSIYYRLPLAIEATDTSGETRVFAGCYELRMTNPGIATDEFVPLRIEGGKFSASSTALDDAVPAACGDGAAMPPTDILMDRATALYEASFSEICLLMNDPSNGDKGLESHEIRFRYAYEDETAPERTARLFSFPCNRGAYNESSVYIFANDAKELRALSFATPELDIRYRDNNQDGPVEAIYVIGFRTAAELVNAGYDDATRTLHSNAKWRGLGDASSQGSWLFRDGDFSLVRFDVDASYDGEINPQTVVDYLTGP